MKEQRRTIPSVTTPRSLTASELDRMFAILGEHFENVERGAFEKDLAEKDWVIRIDDAAGCVQGFSTLRRMTVQHLGERVHAFFSGDTVLAKAYMSESSWMTVWCELAFSQAARMAPEKAYWLLLTATHRTYRILPSCFRSFHPDPKQDPSRDTLALLGKLVRQKFPDEYQAHTGTVVLHHPIPYRSAQEVEAAAGEHHEANRWFRLMNPGYLRGDFLCCLTELNSDNLTSVGKRILGSLPVQQTTLAA
jgi:hypothetical protein